MSKSAVLNHDDLLAGSFPVVTKGIEMETDLQYKRGTIMAMVDGTGPLVNYASQTSGIDVIYGILVEDADSSQGILRAPVYLTGEFNKNKLILFNPTTGETPDDHFDEFRALNIHLKDSVQAKEQEL